MAVNTNEYLHYNCMFDEKIASILWHMRERDMLLIVSNMYISIIIKALSKFVNVKKYYCVSTLLQLYMRNGYLVISIVK